MGVLKQSQKQRNAWNKNLIILVGELLQRTQVLTRETKEIPLTKRNLCDTIMIMIPKIVKKTKKFRNILTQF